MLIPLSPQILAAAIAFSSAVCTLVTRIGLVHGPRIVELIDVLFAEGVASAAAARHGARALEPQVLDRLARQFSDLPNARTTILMCYQLTENALLQGKLYGKEVKAVVDAALHHRFEASKVTETLRKAAEAPIRAAGSPGKGTGQVVVHPPGPGPVPTNRHVLNDIYLKEQRKARQGSQHPGGMKL